MDSTTTRVDARLWIAAADFDEDLEGYPVNVEVERTEPNEIALHTFIDGEGSRASFYVDRETAIDLASHLLQATRFR